MHLKDPTLLRDKSFLVGNWCSASDGSTFSVSNPANGERLAQVADADIEDCEKVIQEAQVAYLEWKNVSAKYRSKILRAWFDEIKANAGDLAVLMTLEQGKPLNESRGEISYGAAYIEWFSEEAKRAYGDVIPTNTTDKRAQVIKQGVGVVAAITPWNFPSAMIARKAAPAIAAGCSFIVKPAAQTPLSALALAACAERAGVPSGVFNVICSTKASEIGKAFCEHPLIKKISFTGSTRVGKTLIKQSADTVKRMSMELGGNAPFIVFDDADLESAVKGLIASKFRNAGQTCVCANRIFVHQSVYQEFFDKLVDSVRQLKIGSGLDEASDLGPLIDASAKEKVERLLEEAKDQGAEIIRTHEEPKSDSLFVAPKLIKNASFGMKVCEEEIFGPLVPLVPFSSEEEVIDLANKSNYGLASYFYTQNLARSVRVSEALEYGMVGINEGNISAENVPFGGVKESGFGREGSKYGLDEYLDVKYICQGNL